MKRILLSALFAIGCMTAVAQSQVKYGFISYNALLQAMPEYTEAQHQMGELRKKYEAEAAYNEQSFKRQFAEFLQGQKDFPQNILLKRQRSLQDAMEKSLKFRHDIDSILVCAETEALAPVRKRLDDAIKAVGLEHGYEYIINTDANAYPFIHHAVAEDANTYVKGKLK